MKTLNNNYYNMDIYVVVVVSVSQTLTFLKYRLKTDYITYIQMYVHTYVYSPDKTQLLHELSPGD